uniref:Putative secreted protein n=1 Tax=Panstrongylus lignarius TaxID=156445 RepID=A0A224Y4S7_9HEMI
MAIIFIFNILIIWIFFFFYPTPFGGSNRFISFLAAHYKYPCCIIHLSPFSSRFCTAQALHTFRYAPHPLLPLRHRGGKVCF